MTDSWKTIPIMLLAALVIANMYAFILGIILHRGDRCDTPFDRPALYVAPAFAVGCWMFTPFEEQSDDGNVPTDGDGLWKS